MKLRTRLATWLDPQSFSEFAVLRASIGAIKQHAALRIDLAERIASNHQNGASSANAQYERLYSLVFERLTPAERKRLSLDVGLPVAAYGKTVRPLLPQLSAESLLSLVRSCDGLRDESGLQVVRDLVLSDDALDQLQERQHEWLALE